MAIKNAVQSSEKEMRKALSQISKISKNSPGFYKKPDVSTPSTVTAKKLPPATPPATAKVKELEIKRRQPVPARLKLPTAVRKEEELPNGNELLWLMVFMLVVLLIGLDYLLSIKPS